jgi:hypothetical protein
VPSDKRKPGRPKEADTVRVEALVLPGTLKRFDRLAFVLNKPRGKVLDLIFAELSIVKQCETLNSKV